MDIYISEQFYWDTINVKKAGKAFSWLSLPEISYRLMEVVGTIVTIVVIIFVLAAETNGGKYQGQNPQAYHDQSYDQIEDRKYCQNSRYD